MNVLEQGDGRSPALRPCPGKPPKQSLHRRRCRASDPRRSCHAGTAACAAPGKPPLASIQDSEARYGCAPPSEDLGAHCHLTSIKQAFMRWLEQWRDSLHQPSSRHVRTTALGAEQIDWRHSLILPHGKAVSGLFEIRPWKRRRDGGETPKPTSIISRGLCAGTVPIWNPTDPRRNRNRPRRSA